MFKNYLKIALRNMKRHAGYSLINIAGLALGITICFFITLFIIHELSYDRFFEGAERIFRVTTYGQINGQPIDYGVSMVPLADYLGTNYPEVQYAARINNEQQIALKFEDKVFYENAVLRASPDFFNIFTHRLIQGTADNVLKDPNTIVLTESLAEKYFGDTNPIGKVLKLNNDEDIVVTGVCENIPSNTHLKFNAILSNPIPVEDNAALWGQFSAFTYIKLNENVDATAFAEKIRNLAMDKMEINLETHGMEFFLKTGSIIDIHLYSHLMYNLGDIGDINYVYIFTAIALFILIIACINFINLTTAHYSVRAKEIGVRKVIGADKRKIVSQFLYESVLITIIAALIAAIMVKLLLPVFSNVVGKQLNLNLLLNGKLISAGILFILLIGAVSGFYPAVFLSSISPISNIRGNSAAGYKRPILRNVLVVFQFVISISLICSTGIIYKQWQYFQHKNLGFDKENVLILPLNGEEVLSQVKIVKDKMLQLPGVLSASISSNYPYAGFSRGHGFFPEGFNTEKPWLFKTMSIDADFLKTFDIQLMEGRNFSPAAENEQQKVLINETLAREVGWEHPMEKTINDPTLTEDDEGLPLTIIGVVSDFHINSLREKIEPMIFYPTNHGGFLSLRLAPGNVFQVLDAVENQWKSITATIPFNYIFLDDRFDEIHLQERKLGQTFIYFTALAIIIACMGLFGLASYATTRRIKEIGIRKVLGSSVPKIMLLVSKDFTILVLLANVIAFPIAWYAMNCWLQNFPYRTIISIWDFLISGIIALAIAIITVSYYIIKAANANPVKSLRYE